MDQMGGVAGPKSLRQLLDAVIGLGSDLDLGPTLYRIVVAATSLADARYGALGVLDETRTALSDFITVGIDDVTRTAIGDLPKGHGILGLLIADPRPLRLPDLREHPGSYGFPPKHPQMRSFLGVPIVVRGDVFGNLYLTDKQSQEVFTDVDEELVVALAAAAAVAIENARLHARVQAMALLEDRERIAMDLHDTVIQQLFAIGLSMEATTRLIGEDAARSRIQSAVDDLDATIKRIRTTIFALGASAHVPGGDLRSRVLGLAEEMAPSLSTRPAVTFEGPLESAVSATVGHELVVALQELLSNVARHAHASLVSVSVVVADGLVTLRVDDDGIGPPDLQQPRSGLGLRNLATRAARVGGSFSIDSRPAGGTTAVWSARSSCPPRAETRRASYSSLAARWRAAYTAASVRRAMPIFESSAVT